VNIWNVLLESRAVTSGTEAKRLIYDGGVVLDNMTIANPDYIVPDGEHVVRVGARKRIVVVVEKGALVTSDPLRAR
jgi:predicted rRNA methylase YqxC with S4 and FtsJ domains